jgi:hypothetical protein
MTACGPTKLDGRKRHRNENLHDKPQQSKLDGAAIKRYREGLCSRDQYIHPIRQSDAGSTAALLRARTTSRWHCRITPRCVSDRWSPISSTELRSMTSVELVCARASSATEIRDLIKIYMGGLRRTVDGPNEPPLARVGLVPGPPPVSQYLPARSGERADTWSANNSAWLMERASRC